MIKVLHLITSLDTGGAEITLRRLLSRFNRQKFQNIVVSLTCDGPVGAQIRELGVPVHVIGMRRGVPSPSGFWLLWRLICQERPAILQTWLYHSDLVGYFLGRAAGVNSIVWNIRCADTGDMYSRGIRRLTFKALVHFSPRIDTIIANSYAGRAHHEACGYLSSHWQVVPNGYDTEQLRPQAAARSWLIGEADLESDDFIIGIVARFDPLKGHEIFLQAASMFAANRSRAKFVMVGSGLEESNIKLMALIDKYGVRKRVRLLGERTDISRVMSGFDIAACTSHSEGFPNMVAEAMACGIPCVATNVGDVERLMDGTGWLVTAGDPAAVTAAWKEAADLSPALRQRVGKEARARIVERYSLDATTLRYEEIYSALAETSASRPA